MVEYDSSGVPELWHGEAFSIRHVTRDYAETHVAEFDTIANEIPDLQTDPFLAEEETPSGKLLHTKWLYSLVLLDDDAPIGSAIGYERRANGPNYPQNSLYLDILALKEQYRRRRLGRQLLSVFMEQALARKKGLYEQLEGAMRFSLTTSAKAENASIIRLYQRFGFILPQTVRWIYGDPYYTMFTGAQLQRFTDL